MFKGFRSSFLLVALCAASSAFAGPSITKFGVTINNAAAVYPGNVLFADCSPPNPDGEAKIMLINQNGTLVKTWSNEALVELAKPVGTDGTVLTWRRTPQSGTGCGDADTRRGLWKIHPNNAATRVYYDPDWRQNHDFEVLPDGTFMVNQRKVITNTSISSRPFYDNQIVRMDSTGKVLWSWSTVDHYNQLGLSAEGRNILLAGTETATNPADLFHTNSIQYIPPNASAASNAAFTPGNILVSQRNTNLIFVIDYASGNIIWQVGNISVGQHSVKVIPTGLPGDGHLLLYNNGGTGGYPKVTQLWSSVDEYDPVAGKLVWRYTTQVPALIGLNSFWRGGAQRLPNGNTFIDEAQWGRFFEVDTKGNIVWEYLHPFPNPAAPDRTIFRAYKVEPCWPGCIPQPGSTTGTWTW